MFLWPQTAIKWPEMLQNLSKSASLKKLSSSASFCGLRVPSWTQPAGHASTRVRGSGGQKNWKNFFLPNQLKMMQNGAQTPPITIFSTFSMTSNEIWPLWHLAALLLPLHHQAVISLLPAGSLTRESGPGPWLHSKRCEICSKTCKYGVWEGFLAIWGHFQVIREKNFFSFFWPLDPSNGPSCHWPAGPPEALPGSIQQAIPFRKEQKHAGLCLLVLWQREQPCGTFLESRVHDFPLFGSAISILEK